MRRALSIGALLIALAAPAAWGAESWGYQIAHELFSPFCPGRTLASCPSDKANELRLWILLQESAGASQEEVEAELVARFGESILPAPPPRDVTALAGYAVPILAIVAGAPLLFWFLRRMTTAPAAADVTSPAPVAAAVSGASDEDLAAEVDRELRERSA
jgi:cytochrome c-type biogenesis protein CcmH/NrfF